MKVYVAPPAGLSRAMTRVSDALTRYAPAGVRVVDRQDEADLVILHVIGWTSLTDVIERLESKKQSYGIIQYCMRTTERPLTRAWLPLWSKAAVLWSYYDLPALALEDHLPNFSWSDQRINFYYAPLGVDPEVFKPIGVNGKPYTILTSGYVAYTEGVAEAAVATEHVRGVQFHLGPEMNLGPHVRCMLGINDERLAYEYTKSSFVAGLRRKEGFELPALEGLLCGARPIVFDAPHYRQWYNGFAEFIPEGSFDETVSELEKLFLAGPREVTEAERNQAVEKFNWEKIIQGFWQRI